MMRSILNSNSMPEQSGPLASDSMRSKEVRQSIGGLANLCDLKVLRIPQWSNYPSLIHGFSTRGGGVSEIAGAAHSTGDLNLGFTSRDSVEAVSLNRERFLNAVVPNHSDSESRWGLVTLRQMHSGLARRVGRAEVAERASLWGDGLLTDAPGILLGIQTADCLPVLIADRKRRAVGAFHAGWRGTLKGIVERGVASMVREFESSPRDLVAAIGPGIGQCCFAVGVEVRDLFAARYMYSEELFSGDKGLSLDLAEANRRQLLDAGLSPDAIVTLNACTSCRTDAFFSYRAERGKTGRLMAVIGVAPY
jgi:polyphenol oxidase